MEGCAGRTWRRTGAEGGVLYGCVGRGVEDDVPADGPPLPPPDRPPKPDEHLRFLGLEDRFGYIYESASGPCLGRLHDTVGRSLKATCKIHKLEKSQCICWINLSGDRTMDGLLIDTYDWLSRGRSCSAKDHADRALELKLKYGMKPRK
jgi:hypothetical protein